MWWRLQPYAVEAATVCRAPQCPLGATTCFASGSGGCSGSVPSSQLCALRSSITVDPNPDPNPDPSPNPNPHPDTNPNPNPYPKPDLRVEGQHHGEREQAEAAEEAEVHAQVAQQHRTCMADGRGSTALAQADSSPVCCRRARAA